MYCWGSTENGELGLGDEEGNQVLCPKLNSFGLFWKIKQIACGLTHTLFLSDDGQVYSCGSHERGQLGHNKQNKLPEHVDALEGYTITLVAVGDQHSVALSSCGTVYAWGENGFGQLGINSSDSQMDFPRLVKTLAKKHVVQVSCGANHTLALTLDNEVYAWGDNSNGQLGLGHRDSPVDSPHNIKLLNSIHIAVITAGGQHSAGITQAGFLLTWGSNKYGQLGRPTDNITNCCSIPKLVPNLATYSEPLRYVALGESHTAVLDSYGKLWTFGHGKYGQLGHGSWDDSSVPRPVIDLVGSKVSQVACGRCHTLVYLSDQGQLYAFGQGTSGQLGMKVPQNNSLPQSVEGPWRGYRNAFEEEKSILLPEEFIFYIYAGGDTSFVSVSKEKKGIDFCLTCPFDQALTIQESKIDAMVSLCEDEMVDEDLFTYCEIVLGSLGCWNASFLKAEKSKVDHCLDFRLAEDCLSKLGRIRKETLREIANVGIEKATKELPIHPPTPEGLRAFIVLPLWKGFTDIKNSSAFHKPFANALLALNTTSLLTFKKWMHSLPLDYLRLLLGHYKKVVAYIIVSQKNVLEFKPLSKTIEDEKKFLLSSLKVLDLLYQENKNISKKNIRVPYEEFYIPEIADNVDIRRDYYTWLNPSPRPFGESSQICFCEYSFLFDSQAKTLLLRADATRQMQGAIDVAFQQTNPLMWFLNPNELQFLTIHVRRDNLVTDTLSYLGRCDYSELKKPLKIHFIGEEAEDAGGVRKEFFLLLMQELLNPDYGMFTEYPETNMIWFRRSAFEVDEIYTLVGTVCGLAIYNFTIINLPFPLALYKKLLDEPVNIDDLAELDPSLVKNLKILKEYENHDVEDTFCLNFTVTEDHFGETKVISLKPSGEDIPVTFDNKQEYVDLMVDWRLNKSIEKQYQAFHKGFHRVCGGGVLKLFQPFELMALVTGNENYDWTEFQKNTVYKGEYHAKHSTIELFWEVFWELTHEQKKMFLKFLTGCDRIPILGMKAIKMVIDSTADTSYLPVAHTCVIQLDLPKYGTKEKLKYKLLQAIQQSEGFGLV